MLGKIVFVLVSIGFLVLIGLFGHQLVEFTVDRISNNDSVSSYWSFWLLWLGPVVIGVAAIIGGIDTWLHPQPSQPENRPQAVDPWVLPR